MFTIEDIKAAHSKVKSGADFPAYIQDIKKLGVSHYRTFVADGHTQYHGANDFTATSLPKYETLAISEVANNAQFQAELKAHQQGKNDYLTFCKIAADLGVAQWAVRIDEMTCTYYDKAGQKILVEQIPQPR